MKIKKVAYWSIVVVMLAIFFVKAYYKDKQASAKWHESGYYGMIEEIQYFHGNRGDARILMNGNWKTIGTNEDKISNYIKVGDSLVKDRNSELIIVYSKDSMNLWKPRKFE